MTTSSLAATPSPNVHSDTIVEAATSPLVLQIIPSVHHRQGRDDEQVQLATTMRSLVLDQLHPIALEVSGTDQQRSLLIRARNADDLKHAEMQLQARLPQATFIALVGRDDPFALRPDETVSVVELQAGQASYLPLQEFEHRTSGEDPLLGILGALDGLPDDLRAVAQLALVPAPATWSQGYQRKALEHALEPERQHDRQRQGAERGDGGGAPSTLMLVLGALFLAGYFLLHYDPSLMPTWGPSTFQALLDGKWQQVLSGPHHLQVEGMFVGLLFLLMLPLVLLRVWKRMFRQPLYDMRSVAEKTSRPAYHVRLRLYVIGPGVVHPPYISRWHSVTRALGTMRRSVCKGVNTGLLVARRVCTNRWHRLLRIGRTAGTRVWFDLHRCISFGRAQQWKPAAKALGHLMGVVGKGGWSLVKRGGRLWRHDAQAVGRLILLIGRRMWFLGTWGSHALMVALLHTISLGWQQWREARYQQGRRRQILARLIAAYRQYHLASGNYFVPKQVSTRRAYFWVSKGTWWKGVGRSRHLIDVEALGALWHMPADQALPDLAHVAYRRSRTRLLPPSLSHAQHEVPIGFSVHAGHRVPFGFPADCFESNLLIGGKTGEGKSVLFQHLLLRRLREKGGLILIDPHGDLAEQTLALIPPERWDDVVFIDLSDDYFSCGINVLDTTMARGRDKIISDLIKIFSSLWTSWGSRMEISFEYALRTLYEANRSLCTKGKADQQYTLLDIMALLTNESFCHALLEDIDDPFVRRWWASYYDPLSLQMQRDRADPVLSKVAKFEGIIARRIVGQSQCSIDFSECIAKQKIVVIKLAKGVIGDDVSRILGATLLGFLNVALEEQGKVEGAERNHFPIFIDEFQTLDGVDWGSALAELRKFGATYFLATQSLEYLREKQLLPAIFASIKQFALFRMSAEDAKILYQEMDVDPEDIMHRESLTCYLKLLSRGLQHPTFSLNLSFPPQGKKEDAKLLRARSRQEYMRPSGEVEAEVKERLARPVMMVPTTKETDKKEAPPPQPKEGHARQDGGSRGRRAEELRKQQQNGQQAGEITNMNWKETVGPSEERTEDDEQEGDPDDRAEE